MSGPCERVEGALALDALGQLPEAERPGLRAHLDGCAACRELSAELHETAGALAAGSDELRADRAALPPSLTEHVLGTLHDHEVARTRRHRRTALGAGLVLAAATCVALVALVLPTAPAQAPGRTEVLRGAGAASATAVLTARPWGTAIALTERGLAPGRVYEVSMRTAAGTWWTTGSYRSVAHGAVHAQMSCSVALAQVTGLRVTASTGRVVLESVAAPGTRW